MSAVLPEEIECVVVHEGKPIAGLMLDAKLETKTKNPYVVPLGPTRTDGRAILVHRAIKEWADSELSLAIMDYDPLEGTFAGIVEVHVTTKDEIDAALNAHEMFKQVFKYPTNYVDNLHQAQSVLEEIGGSKGLSVSGRVKPESIKLIVRR